MSPSNDVQSPRRTRLLQVGRGLFGGFVFAGGLLAAGVFSSAVPAAPQDCLPPPVGCVTTSVPSVPSVTVPGVTLPTLPTTPGTTTTTGSTPATTTATGTVQEDAAPTAALSAQAVVRVRGHGATRVVQIRLRLSQRADVSALLSRSGGALARREFAGPAGTSLFVLHVGRRTRAGPATLFLTYRPASGRTATASYRLRLPR